MSIRSKPSDPLKYLLILTNSHGLLLALFLEIGAMAGTHDPGPISFVPPHETTNRAVAITNDADKCLMDMDSSVIASIDQLKIQIGALINQKKSDYDIRNFFNNTIDNIFSLNVNQKNAVRWAAEAELIRARRRQRISAPEARRHPDINVLVKNGETILNGDLDFTNFNFNNLTTTTRTALQRLYPESSEQLNLIGTDASRKPVVLGDSVILPKNLSNQKSKKNRVMTIEDYQKTIQTLTEQFHNELKKYMDKSTSAWSTPEQSLRALSDFLQNNWLATAFVPFQLISLEDTTEQAEQHFRNLNSILSKLKEELGAPNTLLLDLRSKLLEATREEQKRIKEGFAPLEHWKQFLEKAQQNTQWLEAALLTPILADPSLAKAAKMAAKAVGAVAPAPAPAIGTSGVWENICKEKAQMEKSELTADQKKR